MHRPDREFRQLCDSGPFRVFCKTPLPTPDQRLICRACGLEVDESGHIPDVVVPAARGHTVCGGHEELRYVTDPEQLWTQEGRSPWTAPYVWETNYMED